MGNPKIRDIKKEDRIEKETGIATPGASLKDRVAYKQCVEQQKRMRSSNPWAMCSSQFGIGKSDLVPVGQSFAKMQKKETNEMKTNRSDVGKIMAAEKEHMKPTHPQIKVTTPEKVHVKHPIFKTELEPGMSWNQLKKMQSEEVLAKATIPSYDSPATGTLKDGTKFHLHANHPSNSHLTREHHAELAAHHASLSNSYAQSARTGERYGTKHSWSKQKEYREHRDFHAKQAKIHHDKAVS